MRSRYAFSRTIFLFGNWVCTVIEPHSRALSPTIFALSPIFVVRDRLEPRLFARLFLLAQHSLYRCFSDNGIGEGLE
jgi:hypothetical protein